MLKSRRLATVSVPDLTSDLAILDAQETSSEYDSFTFGSWSSLVLANSSGSVDDTAFRPHSGPLRETELGRRLPAIMSLVTRHFDTSLLQWVRVFSLSDGILAPHVDFLEFDEPGTRLQIPLRTTTEALHSENDIVYHLRKGEIWQIHTTDPHSACSGTGPTRLSLCLDFAGSDFALADITRDTIPATRDIHFVERPPISAEEVEELLSTGPAMTAENLRESFRKFAAVHFKRALHAADSFDLFSRAAERSGDPTLKEKADAFRVYCIEKRAYRENFTW